MALGIKSMDGKNHRYDKKYLHVKYLMVIYSTWCKIKQILKREYCEHTCWNHLGSGNSSPFRRKGWELVFGFQFTLLTRVHRASGKSSSRWTSGRAQGVDWLKFPQSGPQSLVETQVDNFSESHSERQRPEVKEVDILTSQPDLVRKSLLQWDQIFGFSTVTGGRTFIKITN